MAGTSLASREGEFPWSWDSEEGKDQAPPPPLLDKALVKELGHLGRKSKCFSSFCAQHLPCHLLLLPVPPGQITARMEHQGQQPWEGQR